MVKACNFIKRDTQHRYVPINIMKFLRAPILQKNYRETASAVQFNVNKSVDIVSHTYGLC